MAQKRVEANYIGRVQGIGFRFTVESLAIKYKITGYVKNLSDGGVEVVGEGEEENVKSFLDILQSEMESYIDKINIAWFPADGTFKSFAIR